MNWNLMRGVAFACLAGFGFTSAGHAQELIKNANFESGGLHWGANAWGGAGYKTINETQNVKSGKTGLRVEVTSLPKGSGYIFQQTHTLGAGRLYEASIHLRAVRTGRVKFFLRKVDPWYNEFTSRTVELDPATNPNWQKITIRGGASADTKVFFGINFLTPGAVVVDDASLKDVTATSIHADNNVASKEPIPHHYFGLHINKGHYGVWPEINHGLLRLWDTGTMWRNLQPQKDKWDWKRMDLYLDLAQRKAKDGKILYTLGQTPAWAAENPEAKSAYGPGASSPPANLDDWRLYVRTVAERYKGKIHFYELWNETEVTGAHAFYTGSVEKMVAMTQAAREEILAIDPNAKILAPNITSSGIGWLESFLRAGGDPFVDIYSIHLYTGLQPENALIILTTAREMLASYSVKKPIWDTEARAAAPKDTVPTDGEARAAVARNYLTKWAFGAENFSWYAWDINSPGLVVLSEKENSATPAAGGIAYREVVNWLTGSRMLSKNIAADGTWIIEIQREGTRSHIVWNVNGERKFSIPTAWGATQKRELTGAASAINDQPITIGIEPVLLSHKRPTDHHRHRAGFTIP